MFAFFAVVISPDNTPSFSDGSLIRLPAELIDKFRVEQYSKITKKGWNVSEFGYDAFVKFDGFGNRLVFPALYLVDGSNPVKKFHGYKPTFSKTQIENYVDQHLGAMTAAQIKSDAELT